MFDQTNQFVASGWPIQAPTPNEPPQKAKPNISIPYIITAIILIAIIITSVIFIIIALNRPPKNTGEESNNNTAKIDFDADKICEQRPNFDDLTKESAYAYKLAVQNDQYCAISALIDDEDLRPEYPKTLYFLLYSYEDPAEINTIANDGVLNTDHRSGKIIDFKIKQKDHYAIVISDKEDNGYHYAGIIFDKNYVNHFNECVKSKDGSTSCNEKTIFTNLDKEWVETGMKLVLIADNQASSAYGYSFKEDNEKYTLKKNNVGLGFNPISSDGANIQYQLTTYTDEYTVNKSTGEFEAVYLGEKYNSGRYTNKKTFPLEQSETMELSMGAN